MRAVIAVGAFVIGSVMAAVFLSLLGIRGAGAGLLEIIAGIATASFVLRRRDKSGDGD